MAKNDYNKIEKDNILFTKFLKNFVIQTLRRATYRWPYKNNAKNLQKLERGLYQCEGCKGTFSPSQIQIDHIVPVIDIEKGFTTWDDFINRLFVKTEELQVLCTDICHKNKTFIENQMRIKNGLKQLRSKKVKISLTPKKKRGKVKP
jgi:5-methylcytosine-specific restriction endonuclease McrA